MDFVSKDANDASIPPPLPLSASLSDPIGKRREKERERERRGAERRHRENLWESLRWWRPRRFYYKSPMIGREGVDEVAKTV